MVISLNNLPETIRRRIVEASCPISTLEGLCWIRQGRTQGEGYGWVDLYNKGFAVHSLVYTILVGPRISGLTFDHLCKVKKCCSPKHPGHSTCQYFKEWKSSGYGHEFTPENTMLWRGKWKGKDKTQRNCRECNRTRSSEYWKEEGRGMPRNWRVAANFHHLGDVVVTVVAPHWQGAIRKAALAIKALPVMKGRRMNMGTFMLQEVEAPVPEQAQAEQLPIPNVDPGPAHRDISEDRGLEAMAEPPVDPPEK